MIKENHVGKYFLYATGEVALVIIGILIALNINNRNLAKQNQTKFEALFSEVSKDLVTDIIEANRVKKNNTQKDSLLTLVINNMVTKEDYETGNTFLSLAVTFSTMSFSNNGYNVLSKEIDKIPIQYKEVVNKLNELYLSCKENIIYHDTRIKKIIEEIDKKWANSKSWYSRYPVIQSRKDRIDYFLNDPYYKNDTKRIQYEVEEIIQGVELYKYKAEKCYLDIVKIIAPKMALPEIISSYPVDVSDDIYKQYIGNYYREGNPIINFSTSAGEFYWSVEGASDKTIWIPKSDTTFVSLHFPYGIVIDKNTDNEVSGFTLRIEGVDGLRPYVKMK